MSKDPRIRAAMKEIMADLVRSIRMQPIPDCLCQFGLDWRSPEFRKTRYFPFAARCKGMTEAEYGLFLDGLMQTYGKPAWTS